MAEKIPLTPREACDKIVKYLPKLGEYEFGRITSEIKRIRQLKKNKSEMKFDFKDEQQNP